MPAKSSQDGPGDALGGRNLFATCRAGKIPPCPELWQQTYLTCPTEKSAEEKWIEEMVIVKGAGRSKPVEIKDVSETVLALHKLPLPSPYSHTSPHGCLLCPPEKSPLTTF